MASFRRKKSQKGKRPELNLIPILDAIFIIIFFLLMSAQFVKFREINSDAPSIKFVERDEDEDRPDPLNLALEIKRDRLVIRIGAGGKVLRDLPLKEDQEYDLDGLRKEIIDLKKGYMHENSVILKPQKSVRYNKIVQVIDALRELPLEAETLSGKNKKGKVVRTRKLFDQIIFETIKSSRKGRGA